VQLILYRIFLFLYRLGIRVASNFNPKAKKWREGRKHLFDRIATEMVRHGERRIWIHCASLGEFEQGRPIMEALRRDYPQYKIVLTFFSPSGYEVRKDTPLADYVFYMPLDGKKKSKRFLELVDPVMTIFVKYEFWYYYLCYLNTRKTPTFIVSAAFRREQGFFQWYGGLFRKMLRNFNHIFVQDQESKDLLAGINMKDTVSITGDTRYDRVAEIANNIKQFPIVEQFAAGNKLLVAGSTWPDDENILKESLSTLPKGWKIIIAPHEIDAPHIKQIQDIFGGDCTLYSNPVDVVNKKVLIIDNIGMLSSLYSYGSIAFVGGGFQKGGIHNALEPAVFGLPVFFGPVYEKFIEAKELVANGYAFPVQNATEFNNSLQQLTAQNLEKLQGAIKAYMQAHTGATGKIMSHLSANYLR
jgi:3-deoxy-D-manno-octulosonic-acid transferase